VCSENVPAGGEGHHLGGRVVAPARER
ncbi:hypothetical protein AVDCRST_MAG82-1100, partial [uncultured Rubrobacteraceae bacterium]